MQRTANVVPKMSVRDMDFLAICLQVAQAFSL